MQQFTGILVKHEDNGMSMETVIAYSYLAFTQEVAVISSIMGKQSLTSCLKNPTPDMWMDNGLFTQIIDYHLGLEKAELYKRHSNSGSTYNK